LILLLILMAIVVGWQLIVHDHAEDLVTKLKPSSTTE
jgi:hypothetical protein